MKKAKPPGREETFEVFRSQGDQDLSAEHYLLKKPSLSRTATGPLKKNQMTDAAGPFTGTPDEPHTLTLSGGETIDTAGNPPGAAPGTNDPQQTETIRLETFRINMQERLAAMQVAQQKAKDQLNELKKQNTPADEPPAE